MMSNNFIDQIEEKPASVTAAIEEPIVSDEEIKRAFDKCIEHAAFNGDGKYHDVMNMYKTSLLYGKNSETESLMSCLLDYFKKCSKSSDVALVNKLAKNITNTHECIKAAAPENKNIFVALVLGYAYSVFSENNG